MNEYQKLLESSDTGMRLDVFLPVGSPNKLEYKS